MATKRTGTPDSSTSKTSRTSPLTLVDFGFRADDTLTQEYGHINRVDLMMRHGDMGTADVIGRHPGLADRCYFIGQVGGPDGAEAETNQQNFQRIGSPQTKYYTLSEVIDLLNHQEPLWQHASI